MKRNVGLYDRIFRLFLGLLLVYLGLITMNGLHGRIAGVAVALASLLPFYMAITASCFVFRWFNIHSLSKKEFDKQEKIE